ncbi:hypothetical protein [Brachybacterium hainanense]|uniref:Recombinase A n=1 Tax=Brachybacterium hainanense TaxID=1541174 RepID=A0ABV6RBJ8_9MICO
MSTAMQAPQRRGQGARLAHAQAVLGAAERATARWGGRIDRTALRRPVPPSPARALTAPQEAPDEQLPARDDSGHLPVPAALAPLVPYGMLRAGSSLAVGGAARSSLLLALAAAAMGEDSWCAIVGMPDAGLRSLLDAGADPDRLAFIPTGRPEEMPQLPQVLSALVDGTGVVVLGPDLHLAPVLWRTLASRARTRDTLVLAADPPGRADLRLQSAEARWQGLGRGSGRLRRRLLRVSAAGRGIAGRREIEVLLPDVQGLLRPASTTTAAPPLLRSVRAPHVVAPPLRRAV